MLNGSAPESRRRIAREDERVSSRRTSPQPDVLWEGSAPGPYDRAADQTANADQRANFRDGTCKVN